MVYIILHIHLKCVCRYKEECEQKQEEIEDDKEQRTSEDQGNEEYQKENMNREAN